MNTPRIACVTCRSIPEPDPDEALLSEALRRAGAEPVVVPWDGEGFDWGSAAVAVPRSTWNYYLDRDAFLAWAARVAAVSRLRNPLPVIRANTDKRYLRALAEAGVPVVPTEFVEPGDDATLASILARRGWDEVVLKPTVGAASYRNRRASRMELAEGSLPEGSLPEGSLPEDHLAELVRDGGAMVQPYLRGVDDPGERSIIWIDGELTHAVRKSPRWAGEEERVSLSTVPLPDGAAALVEAALATVSGQLLYARVDVVPDDDGRLVVMELELTEPSLFLLQHPPAAARFAEALTREALP